MSYTKTYKSWDCMKQRCGKQRGYEKITYCEEWESFINFYRDMGDRPDGKTLDRIDPRGNYCKENCRWATWEEQENNRTNNKKYCYKGELLTVPQIARKLGVSENVLYRSLSKQKAGIEEALRKIHPCEK